MTQFGELSRTMVTIVLGFVVSVIFVGCSGTSPSSITDKWFSAVVKKDYKTAAKYSYALELTEEEKMYIIKKETDGAEVMWSYEIKDEQISADGEKAIVAIYATVENDIAKDREGTNIKIFLIKTKTDGWKVEIMRTFDE